ncbi:MAG TPA: hypothetical protein VMS98_12020 [Thermoanaerobaculia bacterium]|nr:hypothetical protein [Thermoanaerobaculia bacterium]
MSTMTRGAPISSMTMFVARLELRAIIRRTSSSSGRSRPTSS